MTITRELISITSSLERQRSDTMNGYTPPTEYETLAARAAQLRVELTEALGDYDAYLEWANQLSVNTHLSVNEFITAAEAKLAEIEREAAHITAHALARTLSESLAAGPGWHFETDIQAQDHADLLDTQECARW